MTRKVGRQLVKTMNTDRRHMTKLWGGADCTNNRGSGSCGLSLHCLPPSTHHPHPNYQTDRASVVAWWYTLVLERVRPGYRSSLTGGGSSTWGLTWGFYVPGGGGNGGSMDGGGFIGGAGVITGVTTSGIAGSTGGNGSAGGTSGMGRMLKSMSGDGSCTSPAPAFCERR